MLNKTRRYSAAFLVEADLTISPLDDDWDDLLSELPVLSIQAGRLQSPVSEINRALEAAVVRCIADKLGCRFVLGRSALGTWTAIIGIVPVHLRWAARRDNVVLLQVFRNVEHAESTVDIFAVAHALTERETALLRLLATGATLRECAQGMAIRYETARSYLKQVFQKTGIDRQADLARAARNCDFSGLGAWLPGES